MIPVFIAETSEDHIRGLLSSALVFFCNVGVLCAFVIGHFFSYKVASTIYTIFPILFCISVYFLPETPVFLMRDNKISEAESSLAFYRNKEKFTQQTCYIYRAELEKLKNCENNIEKCENSLKLSDFSEFVQLNNFLVDILLLIFFISKPDRFESPIHQCWPCFAESIMRLLCYDQLHSNYF